MRATGLSSVRCFGLLNLGSSTCDNFHDLGIYRVNGVEEEAERVTQTLVLNFTSGGVHTFSSTLLCDLLTVQVPVTAAVSTRSPESVSLVSLCKQRRKFIL